MQHPGKIEVTDREHLVMMHQQMRFNSIMLEAMFHLLASSQGNAKYPEMQFGTRNQVDSERGRVLEEIRRFERDNPFLKGDAND